MKVIVEKIKCISEDMNEKIKQIAKYVELIIIIGNRASNNVNELYHIGLKECGNVMIVERTEDLYLNYAKRFKVIGVIDTNLLPQNEVEEMVDILEKEEVKGYIYGRFK